MITGLTSGYNTDSLGKEIGIFNNQELLYNDKRLRVPDNRRPKKLLWKNSVQFFLWVEGIVKTLKKLKIY